MRQNVGKWVQEEQNFFLGLNTQYLFLDFFFLYSNHDNPHNRDGGNFLAGTWSNFEIYLMSLKNSWNSLNKPETVFRIEYKPKEFLKTN